MDRCDIIKMDSLDRIKILSTHVPIIESPSERAAEEVKTHVCRPPTNEFPESLRKSERIVSGVEFIWLGQAKLTGSGNSNQNKGEDYDQRKKLHN